MQPQEFASLGVNFLLSLLFPSLPFPPLLSFSFSFLFVLTSSTVRKEISGSPFFAALRTLLPALFSEPEVTQI